MNLSCCSWSYHRALEARQMDFTGWLRVCAEELSVGGVDIIAEHLPRRTRAYYLETKKRCTDGQLTIVCLSPSNNFGQPTAAKRRAEVETVRRWLDAAFVLGAPCLRLFAGWPPAGKGAALWEPMVACFRAAARSAAQAGITLVVEPHNHGGFLPDSRTTLRLIRELDTPWVRVNLDTGNFQEADPYAGIEACLPFASHVVAKIHRLSPRGDEVTLDYEKILILLKRHRYHGFVTVEYEGRTDERIGVRQAVMMLRRLAVTYGI